MDVMEADPLQKNQVGTADSADSSNISSLNMKTVHRPISTSEFTTRGCEEKDLEGSRIPTIPMSFQDSRSPLHRPSAAAGAFLTTRIAAGVVMTISHTPE